MWYCASSKLTALQLDKKNQTVDCFQVFFCSVFTYLIPSHLRLVLHSSYFLPAEDYSGVSDIPHNVSWRLTGCFKYIIKA